MNESISYDWAADLYDRSRDFPEEIAAHGIPAILETAGPGRLLDVGTGTGRFSIPLWKAGADLVGIDLSAKMMARLREKSPPARLAQADASCLPFAADSFDAVTTSHVMHLVGPWREALGEFRRVLKPGGVYINSYSERQRNPIREQIRDYWQRCLTARGAVLRRPGIRDGKELQDELLEMGAKLRHVEVIHFIQTGSLREAIERIAARTHSNTLDVPDEIFAAGVRDLRAWAAREFDDLDTPLEEDACFVLDVARFEA